MIFIKLKNCLKVYRKNKTSRKNNLHGKCQYGQNSSQFTQNDLFKTCDSRDPHKCLDFYRDKFYKLKNSGNYTIADILAIQQQIQYLKDKIEEDDLREGKLKFLGLTAVFLMVVGSIVSIILYFCFNKYPILYNACNSVLIPVMIAFFFAIIDSHKIKDKKK